MDATKTGKITMTDAEIAGLSWSKAQFSNINGACVEIASAPGKIAIRDSKDPGGPVLIYTPIEFRAFLDGARNGEFDSLLQLSILITGLRQGEEPHENRRAALRKFSSGIARKDGVSAGSETTALRWPGSSRCSPPGCPRAARR